MNYHIEGEISRITLKLDDKGFLGLRLKPSPEYVRKEGDSEKALLVSDGIDTPIPFMKEDFDKKDIAINKYSCSLLALLLSCKANRSCIWLEFSKPEGNEPEFPFNQSPVSLSLV